MRKILNDIEGDITPVTAIIGVVGLLISIIIGVIVWFKINPAIYSAAQPTGHGIAGINTAFNATNSTANTVWSLFPVVGIIMIAAIIIAIVSGFGQGPQ